MRTSGSGMCCYARVIEGRALNPLVIVMRNAHANADIATVLTIEHHPGVLNRFPCRLQKQPMLRIYIRRFPRRDTKELRVKLVDLIEEAAALGKSFSRNSRFGIIIAF